MFPSVLVSTAYSFDLQVSFLVNYRTWGVAEYSLLWFDTSETCTHSGSVWFSQILGLNVGASFPWDVMFKGKHYFWTELNIHCFAMHRVLSGIRDTWRICYIRVNPTKAIRVWVLLQQKDIKMDSLYVLCCAIVSALASILVFIRSDD